eukprot:UN1285
MESVWVPVTQTKIPRVPITALANSGCCLGQRPCWSLRSPRCAQLVGFSTSSVHRGRDHPICGNRSYSPSLAWDSITHPTNRQHSHPCTRCRQRVRSSDKLWLVAKDVCGLPSGLNDDLAGRWAWSHLFWESGARGLCHEDP